MNMTIKLLLSYLFFASLAHAGVDPSNKFKLGDATTSDKVFEANLGLGTANPKFRFHLGTGWQQSTDGSTFTSFGGSTAFSLNTQTGSTYTFQSTDVQSHGSRTLVVGNSSSPQTFTVPSGLTTTLGDEIKVLQQGTGDVVIASGGGVTINTRTGNTMVAQYSYAWLTQITQDVWTLIGEHLSGFIHATGGTITTYSSGGHMYNVHTFTSNGTFVITSGTGTIESLIIGGGGGSNGATNSTAGGSGAGAVIHNSPGNTYSAGSFPIGVGPGGTGQQQGFSSTFDIYTAVGGGYGGSSASSPQYAGGNGGSGGGGGPSTGAGTGGTGTALQGNNGGGGNSGGISVGGGGGGCGSVGATASTSVAGNGGTGCSFSITGSVVTYASGGGGGSETGGTAGTASAGGGGNGCNTHGCTPTNGTDGLGGGAGGGQTPGTGGKGVVILVYQSG